VKDELSVASEADRRQSTGRYGLGSISASWTGFVIVFFLAIGCAETMIAFVGVLPGLACHAVLVAVSLIYVSLGEVDWTHGDPGPTEYGPPVLALMPLLRILSLTMPLGDLPDTYSFALIGLPLLLAIGLAVRRTRLTWTAVGLGSATWWQQILIALSGIPLGLIGFLVLRPEPLVANPDWLQITLAALTLVLIVAPAEELLFRGLILKLSTAVFGANGVIWASLVVATMYLGSRSPVHVAAMGVLGLYLSYCAYWSGSLWGVLVCRALILTGTMLVFPFAHVAIVVELGM
jgi:uncharacterized protein